VHHVGILYDHLVLTTMHGQNHIKKVFIKFCM